MVRQGKQWDILRTTVLGGNNSAMGRQGPLSKRTNFDPYQRTFLNVCPIVYLNPMLV